MKTETETFLGPGVNGLKEKPAQPGIKIKKEKKTKKNYSLTN